VVISILDRKGFVDYWNKERPGLGDPDSGLWAYENANNIHNEYFVCVKPVHIPTMDKHDFWGWTIRNTPSMLCYSASDAQEWYGFKTQSELNWWILRWA
jgi:hypothetical protein